jgi:hypothetical protein
MRTGFHDHARAVCRAPEDTSRGGSGAAFITIAAVNLGCS